MKPGAYRVGGKRVRVLSDRSAPPSTRLYRQRIPRGGYGYLTTRDGIELAINVHLPSGPGPYPTLVEYSGYGYANPDGGQSSIAAIANLLGYAVVDVNMRGTGCSGGAFDYFETLQGLDGYDVIETVARQPWVRGKPGMVGLSYGGISQLFVAATRPPSLAAITPLSVIDNTQTTLYPGGILNTGFAFSWAKDRVHDAKPASATGGQAWALKRIRGGDRTCKANQVLHPAAVDLLAKARRNDHYVPKVADPLAPVRFVNRIRVPVYLACQWTDEQTGGHCPRLPRRFTGTQRKWFTFTNGTHIDSLDPAIFMRWFDFLELYVAKRRPQLPAGVRDAAPLVFATAMGVPGQTLPDDPIQAQPTYEAALAAFQALPPVRILFDNGAGSATPGAPVAGFERSFSRFPLPGTAARSWWLADDGALTDRSPLAGTDSFTWSRTARPPTSFTGNTAGGTNGLWTAAPPYRWTQNPPGTALSYVSAPLGADTAVVGAGALEAWIRSAARSVDLQATVSEVRPDGQETFVQSGWLRASERKLSSRSTLLEPELSLRARDSARLPKGALREGHGAALLPGPRLPGRLARAGDARGAARRSARVELRRDPAAGEHARDARARGVAALAARAAGGGRDRRADPAAAVPGAARPALPAVRALGARRRSRHARMHPIRGAGSPPDGLPITPLWASPSCGALHPRLGRPGRTACSSTSP